MSLAGNGALIPPPPDPSPLERSGACLMWSSLLYLATSVRLLTGIGLVRSISMISPINRWSSTQCHGQGKRVQQHSARREYASEGRQASHQYRQENLALNMRALRNMSLDPEQIMIA